MSVEPSAEELRERVARLEEELAERAARANAALAEAQDRTYWLERLHLDMNALMRRPAAVRLVGLITALRSAYRAVLRMREAAESLPESRRAARAERAADRARAREGLGEEALRRRQP
jgi:hypothetical protein